MPVSKSPRLGLTRWSSDNDPWNRQDWDDDNAALEASAAIYGEGVHAIRPVAGKRGRFYFATDTRTIWYDDGVAWVNTREPIAGFWKFPAASSRGPTSGYIGVTSAVWGPNLHTSHVGVPALTMDASGGVTVPVSGLWDVSVIVRWSTTTGATATRRAVRIIVNNSVTGDELLEDVVVSASASQVGALTTNELRPVLKLVVGTNARVSVNLDNGEASASLATGTLAMTLITPTP